MSDLPIYPTADDIARAVVAASRITHEPPEDVLRGGSTRARNIALAALKEAFPSITWPALGRMLTGSMDGNRIHAAHLMARKAKWWRDEFVDETLGAIVAPHYGERAA